MNCKLRGRVVTETEIREQEFENLEEYIEVTLKVKYCLDEKVELIYNGIPLETTDMVDSEENIELIIDQIKEINKCEYMEEEEIETSNCHGL